MQEKLFFDNEIDALVSAILSAGGFKYVAGKLWPNRKPESAYARLKACVDESKDEKLEFREMIAIARMAKEKGCHAFMQYLDMELGYESRSLEPQDEHAELQKKFIAAVGAVQDIAERIERTHQRMAVAR